MNITQMAAAETKAKHFPHSIPYATANLFQKFH